MKKSDIVVCIARQDSLSKAEVESSTQSSVPYLLGGVRHGPRWPGRRLVMVHGTFAPTVRLGRPVTCRVVKRFKGRPAGTVRAFFKSCVTWTKSLPTCKEIVRAFGASAVGVGLRFESETIYSPKTVKAN